MSETTKNSLKVKAAKKRWEGKSEEDRKAHMRMMGKKGGKALWDKVRRLEEQAKSSKPVDTGTIVV